MANNLILNAEIEKKNNGGESLVLHILRSSSIAITSSGKIYIRIGDNSIPVTSSEDIVRLAADKNSFSWEDALSPYEWQKADKEKLDKFIADIKSSDRVSKFVKDKEPKEILDYFYLTDSESDMMTNLGVLFIGRNTQRGRLSNAPIVQCIKYDEYGEKVNKWVWDDYLLNPQELIESIWETVPEWTETYEISDGMRRKNVPAYEEAVIREILCNSLVHRPYTIRGDIFINIYPDRIEVVNPGQLPLGITPENILHKTYKRNEHFANICYVLHLMEREGSVSGSELVKKLDLSGSDALRAWLNPLLENGLVESTDDKTLGKKYFVADNIKHLTLKKTARQMKNDLIRDAILQDIVDHKDVSIAEVAKRLEDLASYMIIRRNILALVEEGKLLQQGKGRWIRISLNEL